MSGEQAGRPQGFGLRGGMLPVGGCGCGFREPVHDGKPVGEFGELRPGGWFCAGFREPEEFCKFDLDGGGPPGGGRGKAGGFYPSSPVF
ncbi:MAG: hypothetical protein O0X49_05255 [Methanocorpusculum sp.]|nr:hypothetical protein [Methanocorpusculum sp.]